MKRRSFLRNSSLVALPVVFGGIPVAAIEKSSLFNLIGGDTDKILVLIQLNGGNDGLNTIIPLDQYENLLAVRENIIVPENEIIQFDDTNGFHPSWTAMNEMYSEEKLAIVQGVGYPDQNRSHFRSTDIWHTGSASDEYLSTGWLGRYLDLKVPGYPTGFPSAECPDPFALTMGNVVSETCQGTSDNFSFVLNNPEDLVELDEFEGGEQGNGCYAKELGFVRESIRQANAYADSVLASHEAGSNNVEYPDSNLAGQLRTIAKLISGGSQTRIYVASIGGFDTHAYQVDAPGANPDKLHSKLLLDLSEAIKAFQEDIESQNNGERVIGMTFSEFGRRIRSNDAFGTDHGSAAPLFVFGNCVNHGILGSNPEISEDVGVGEGVPMQYDFRSVYGSILIDWFDLEVDQVKEILFDDFQYIPILKSCNSVSNINVKEEALTVQIMPNPTVDIAILEFVSLGHVVHISVLDAVGHVVEVIANKKIGTGNHSIKVNMSNYNTGVYFVRIMEGSRVSTKRIVRI